MLCYSGFHDSPVSLQIRVAFLWCFRVWQTSIEIRFGDIQATKIRQVRLADKPVIRKAKQFADYMRFPTQSVAPYRPIEDHSKPIALLNGQL